MRLEDVQNTLPFLMITGFLLTAGVFHSKKSMLSEPKPSVIIHASSVPDKNVKTKTITVYGDVKSVG